LAALAIIDNFFRMFIKVRVFPNAKKEKIIKKSEDSFDVEVKEKARQNKANKRVTEILSYYFKIPESKLKLVKGFNRKNKIFKLLK